MWCPKSLAAGAPPRPRWGAYDALPVGWGGGKLNAQISPPQRLWRLPSSSSATEVWCAPLKTVFWTRPCWENEFIISLLGLKHHRETDRQTAVGRVGIPGRGQVSYSVLSSSIATNYKRHECKYLHDWLAISQRLCHDARVPTTDIDKSRLALSASLHTLNSRVLYTTVVYASSPPLLYRPTG